MEIGGPLACLSQKGKWEWDDQREEFLLTPTAPVAISAASDRQIKLDESAVLKRQPASELPKAGSGYHRVPRGPIPRLASQQLCAIRLFGISCDQIVRAGLGSAPTSPHLPGHLQHAWFKQAEDSRCGLYRDSPRGKIWAVR